MCSIAGAESGVRQMLQTMKHRAPDDEGVVNIGKYEIGMGRLAVIDLRSGGLCPFQDDEITLAFNGEIYNYIELREELRDSYEFKTDSDTEVLAAAYRKWGIGCLDKLNGMFAFAIFDGEQIVLARDIAGEKPLYYDTNPFRFASEAKALNWRCKSLPPASYLVYKNGAVRIQRWWEPPVNAKLNLDRAEEMLERLLEDSIKLRTRSDVPYGLYLSGGVDSTLISTFHKFDHTFTYTSDDSQKEEFLWVLPKIVWHLDYPVKSFSAFGLWKLAEQAHKAGVKVVLSGEGADELFGGYVRYLPNAFNYHARRDYPSYTGLFPYHGDEGLAEFYGNLRELLRMGDRMAGAWGIENRCPFLDKRIIEFAHALPLDYKIEFLDTKIILNNILYKRKPDYKPIEKAGLFVPVNKWIGSKGGMYEKHDWLEFQNNHA